MDRVLACCVGEDEHFTPATHTTTELRRIEQSANHLANVRGEEDGIYRLVGDVAREAANAAERNAKAVSALVEIFYIKGYSDETRRLARRAISILNGDDR